MAQITSREELEAWLKDKPADWAQVIAARAALRALPYAFGNRLPENWIKENTLSLIRSMSIIWSARNFPAYDMKTATVAARAAMIRADYLSSADVARAVDAATRIAIDSNRAFGSVYFAASSAAGAAGAEGRPGSGSYAAAWEKVSRDYVFLLGEDNSALAARLLTYEPIWLGGEPESWAMPWRSAIDRIRAIDNSYQVWIDWYNRRIEGHDAAFDIPGDTDRIEDKKILARLADATNEDFWDKGATYVNTTLQRWIDEARERVRPSEAPDAIRAIAAEIASPTVTLTNNKLDVTVNTTFDGQTDAANLDEAIAVLRAVVGALLKSLDKDLPRNGNIPYSFAANLTIYDGELAKRGAKPFLGVLVRMEKSVSAGFYADPEMFDAGVTTNFESYFDAHQDFMTHYRRNEEREAKIAQFTIDDAAASGVALTGPVDDVVKEVDALAEQGLVTDGFVQAIKEQQAINDEVALYTSSVPTISGEPTVKEHHILQTVGFYERVLAAASDAVTVAKPLIAFIKTLKEAIEALLKFFV